MIYGRLSDAGQYRGIHPRLDRALSLLREDYLAGIGTERRCIESDSLFVTRFDVTTSQDESRSFEYHRRYLDIFTLVRGTERVDIAGSAGLRVLEQREDYWGCAGQPDQSVILTPGRFLVLFPGDAHRPGMAAAEPDSISRIVFKILFKED